MQFQGERGVIKGTLRVERNEKLFVVNSIVNLRIGAVPVRHFFVVTRRRRNCLTVMRISEAKYRLLGGRVAAENEPFATREYVEKGCFFIYVIEVLT
jgi:hypothetical protein